MSILQINIYVYIYIVFFLQFIPIVCDSIKNEYIWIPTLVNIQVVLLLYSVIEVVIGLQQNQYGQIIKQGVLYIKLMVPYILIL